MPWQPMHIWTLVEPLCASCAWAAERTLASASSKVRVLVIVSSSVDRRSRNRRAHDSQAPADYRDATLYWNAPAVRQNPPPLPAPSHEVRRLQQLRRDARPDARGQRRDDPAPPAAREG